MRVFKKWISLLCALLIVPCAVTGQCLHEDTPPANGQLSGGQQGGQTYESRNGQYIYPHGVLRALILLVELDYANPANDPVLGGTEHWPAHALPVWANNSDPNLNLFDADTTSTPHGMVTRYYHSASSGGFSFLADYLKPDSGASRGNHRAEVEDGCPAPSSEKSPCLV